MKSRNFNFFSRPPEKRSLRPPPPHPPPHVWCLPAGGPAAARVGEGCLAKTIKFPLPTHPSPCNVSGTASTTIYTAYMV